MAKKKGTQYKCEECGLIVTVAKPCGCEPACEIVCWGTPMKEVKAKPQKIDACACINWIRFFSVTLFFSTLL